MRALSVLTCIESLEVVAAELLGKTSCGETKNVADRAGSGAPLSGK